MNPFAIVLLALAFVLGLLGGFKLGEPRFDLTGWAVAALAGAILFSGVHM